MVGVTLRRVIFVVKILGYFRNGVWEKGVEFGMAASLEGLFGVGLGETPRNDD